MTEEEITEYAKQYAWICVVCKYPLKRIEENRWQCTHCEEVSRLTAEIEIWKHAVDQSEKALKYAEWKPDGFCIWCDVFDTEGVHRTDCLKNNALATITKLKAEGE